MAKKKGLGRGLDALIPADAKASESVRPGGDLEGDRLIQCEVSKIKIGGLQPRSTFDEDKIKELAESIEAQGILQPLMARPRKGGGYELIVGERRLRAAKSLGLKKVPVVVREIDDRGALELALVENLQREDLDPIEEASAYRRLLNEFDYTQEQLARRVGKPRTTLSNFLRLLSLPEDVIEDLRSGRLTPGHARALMMAGSEAAMSRLRDAVVEEGLSVRETERRATGEKKKKRSPGRKRSAAKTVDVNLKAVEQDLVRELGTKVRITRSTKGGRIDVFFYSEEEFDRIYRRILGG